MLMIFLLLVVAVALAQNPPVLDCSTFDPAKIKLITFDVFAALMQCEYSMNVAIKEKAPFLTDTQVSNMVNQMINGYGSYQGQSYSLEQTGGAEPFVWMANSTLAEIIPRMGLVDEIPVYGDLYYQIISTWGDQIPWDGTTDTLNIVSKHYNIGPLSNGDSDTLRRAMSVFAPMVQPFDIYSSDFPVGAFKPVRACYDQLSVRTGYARDEILHVAGAPSDGKGAAEAGIFSALTWKPPIPTGTQPCFTLNNITDLVALLNLD